MNHQYHWPFSVACSKTTSIHTYGSKDQEGCYEHNITQWNLYYGVLAHLFGLNLSVHFCLK